MKPSTRPKRPPLRNNKELPEGPSRLGLAMVALVTILIIGSFVYMILSDWLFGTGS